MKNPRQARRHSSVIVSLVTRIIRRRRRRLLAIPTEAPVRRALPLDFSDTRPIEAALYRNIQAVRLR